MKLQKFPIAAFTVLALASQFAIPAFAVDTTDELKLVDESDGGRKFHTGDDKIIVLRLAGTWNEMGQQYGKLLKVDIQPVWDTTVQPMLDKKEITKQQALELFGHRVYDTSSLRMQQFHQGIAKSLGWSVDKVSLLNQSAAMGIYQSKIHSFAGCSSLLAWGTATKDGGMITARNMDWGEAFLKFPVVLTVFNPTDGSNAIANVNWPGWFFAETAINDKGVYVDLHDGTSMGGSVAYIERASMINTVFDMMAECSSAEAMSKRFKTQRADISFIWTVADTSPIGFSFEAATSDSLRRNSDGDALVVVNSFLNPDWGLHVRDTVSNSLTRLGNLRARTKEAHGSIDAGKAMEIFDLKLFNADGTFKKNGGATKPTKQDADLTVYQVVTEPAKLQMWIKVPLKTKWRQVDLKTLFKN